MPFLNEDELQSGTPNGKPADPYSPPSPGLSDLFDAVMGTTSTVGLIEGSRRFFEGEREQEVLSSFHRMMPKAFEAEHQNLVDSYDPLDNIDGYEDFVESFVEADTPSEVASIKRRIDLENKRRSVIADSGWTGVTLDIAAGVTDPVNWLPVGAALRAANTVRKGVVAGAGTALGAALVDEGIQQSTQETRTDAEAAFNIAGTTLLGGVLGGAIGHFKGNKAAAARDLEAMLIEHDPSRGRAAGGGGGGLSAAATRNLSGNALAPAMGTDVLQTLPIVGSPLMRTLTSRSAVVRDIAERLAETPVLQSKNLAGRASATAAETLVQAWQFTRFKTLRAVDEEFVKYRMAGKSKGFGDITRIGARDLMGGVTGPSGRMLNRTEFRKAVGRASLYGDQHPIAEVQRAAEAVRRDFFEPRKNALIEVDLLPETFTGSTGGPGGTSRSYRPRVYDHGRIAARRPELEDVITGALGRRQRNAAEMLEEATRRRQFYEKKVNDLGERMAGFRGDERRSFQKTYRTAQRDLKRAEVARETAIRNRELYFDEGLDSPAAADQVPRWLSDELAKMRKGWKIKPPQSLSSWIVSRGGVRIQNASGDRLSYAGEVEALLGGRKATKPGFIKDDGQSLDEVALAAWEEGYIGLPGGDRPDIDELLAALDSDFGGRPVYRAADDEIVARIEQRAALEQSLNEAGIDIKTSTDAEIAQALRGNILEEADAVTRRAVDRSDVELSTRRASFDKAKATLDDYGSLPVFQKRMRGAEFRLEQAMKDEEHFGWLGNASELDLRDEARQIVDGILGHDREVLTGLPDDLTPNRRGASAGRSLRIVSDTELGEFLIDDIDTIMAHVARQTDPDIEIARQFGRPDMRDQAAEIREDYAIIRERLRIDNSLTPEQREVEMTKLDKAMRADINDLTAMRDRIRGTYGIPSNPEAIGWRVARVLKQVNHVTLMGAAQFPNSLSDLGRSIFQHGLGRFFGDAIVPFIRNLKDFKLTADEYRLGGAAMEVVLDSRISALHDLDQFYAANTRFERGMDVMVKKFSIANLMAPVTDILQHWEGMIAQARILEAAEIISTGKFRGKARALNDRDRTWLAHIGIDEQMAQRIWGEKRHWHYGKGGLRQANARAWDSAEVAHAFIGAMGKSQRSAIVQPLQDKPLWMSTGLGSVIGQFRSFAMANTAKTVVVGAQRLRMGDMRVLQGVSVMVGLGMIGYYFNRELREAELSDDPEVWLAEGIDRSGVTGWLMDASNILDKGNMGARSILGIDQASRYQSRNEMASLLGPSAGRLQDVWDFAEMIAKGEVTRADVRRFRQWWPGQNHFLLRGIFNDVEDGLASVFGLPKQKRPAR